MAADVDDILLNRRPFVPILTVMADYGNAPFLWCLEAPQQAGIGANLCDGTWWDEAIPMTEGLWQKFSDWAIPFDQTAFYSDDFDASDWDWNTFHARGLHLSGWLKEEVGNTYRVIYMKHWADPAHREDERREICADGTLLALPSLRDVSRG